jgi:hypothetical protein
VSRGQLDATIVHPREVFKAALLANAASIIVTHSVARHRMRLTDMCLVSLCVRDLEQGRYSWQIEQDVVT